MIQITSGNILAVAEGIIVQQVNCMGVMGAGLAKQLRAKYPGIFPSYRDFIDKETLTGTSPMHGADLLGKVHLYSCSSTLTIANCFGQYNYGRGLQTDYQALENSLWFVRAAALALKCPVAIPWGIGCGMAGGDWNRVMKILLNAFDDKSGDNTDATIYFLEDKT